MKIAICAIYKNENIYLREWVEHHKRLGFDKIFLYDNNPVDGEYPHQVIGDYITEGFVDVRNVRGYPFRPDGSSLSLQSTVYNQCRIEQQSNYKWMAFIDVDEFIIITPEETQDIHAMFEKFGYDTKKYEQVLMSWRNMSNSGELFYEPKPVMERFTEDAAIPSDKVAGINNLWVKSMVRTDIPKNKGFIRGNEHAINGLYSCSSYGLWIPGNENGDLCQISCSLHEKIYVAHYWAKSFMEYISRRSIESLQEGRLYDWRVINGWDEKQQKILDNFVEYVNNPEVIQNFERK